MVRGVDALLAERDRRRAQPLPGLEQIVREVLGEGGFGGGPAIVRLAQFDPLLAVVALAAGHASILVTHAPSARIPGCPCSPSVDGR